MAAELKIYKYTGTGAKTEVTSIAFKRVDRTVPGSKDAPVDDRGDAEYYAVYTPEIVGVKNSSFETWIKLEVAQVPDTQLSNVRLWVEEDDRMPVGAPSILVGITDTYRKPTDSISPTATNDLYTYTKDSPLLITRGGLGGYEIDPLVYDVDSFDVIVRDPGYGNVFYVNDVRQAKMTVTKGKTHIINNSSGDQYPLRIYQSSGASYVEVTDGVVVTNPGTVNETITITAATLGTIGNDFFYKSPLFLDDSVNIGGELSYFDPDTMMPVGVFNHTVSVVDGVFYIDGVRKIDLKMNFGETHIFTNVNGSVHPFRIYASDKDANESGLAYKGVVVADGGTDVEVVTVTTADLYTFNGESLVYGSPNGVGIGYSITRPDPIEGDYVGKYNMNHIGDSTDFVVFQIQLSMDTTPGNYIPPIQIAYDES